MASTIDTSKPVAGNPTTQSVRDNFAAAKSEIEALQVSDALKAPIAGPTFTGTATIPTAVITTLTFNGTLITASGADLNATTGLTAALAAKAPLASPSFTGTVSIGGTALTSTAAELNYNDITTLGTVQANKTVTAAASAINFNNFDMTNVDINSGTIDGAAIGNASPNSAVITTLTVNNGSTFVGAAEFQNNITYPYTSASASTSYTIDANTTKMLLLVVSANCTISVSNMVDGNEIIMLARPSTATSRTLTFGLAFTTGSTGGNSFSGVLPASTSTFTEFRFVKMGGDIFVTSPSQYS